jgi:hypothetical protein
MPDASSGVAGAIRQDDDIFRDCVHPALPTCAKKKLASDATSLNEDFYKSHELSQVRGTNLPLRKSVIAGMASIDASPQSASVLAATFLAQKSANSAMPGSLR